MSLDKDHDICLDIYAITSFKCHVRYDTLECNYPQKLNAHVSPLYQLCRRMWSISSSSWSRHVFAETESSKQRKVSLRWRLHNDNSHYTAGFRLSSVCAFCQWGTCLAADSLPRNWPRTSCFSEEVFLWWIHQG